MASNKTMEHIKMVVKKMDIWNEHNEFQVEVWTLREEINYALEQAKEISKSVQDRLKLKPDADQNAQTSDSNSDLASVLKKTDDQEESIEDVKIDSNLSKSYKDESYLLLERKIRASEEVYAMDEYNKPWIRCKVISIHRKPCARNKFFIICRLRTCPVGPDSRIIDVNKFAIARRQKHLDKLQVAKRVIAGYTKSRMFPGIIGQQPHRINGYRYLVLMDSGSAIYYNVDQVYPILYQSAFPWQDQRYLDDNDEYNLGALRAFFTAYPKRILVRVEEDQEIQIWRRGSLVKAKAIGFDCDTVRVLYKDDVEESIFLGSTRLIVGSLIKQTQLANVKNLNNLHPNLVIAMGKYHEAGIRALDEDFYKFISDFDKTFYITKGERQTARKSTSIKQQRTKIKIHDIEVGEELETVNFSPETFEESKNHKCSPDCLKIDNLETEISVHDIIDKYRDVSDLKVPLLLGWQRKQVKVPHARRSKPAIIYIAPCGKIFQQAFTIRRYLLTTKSKLDVDYFSFQADIKLNNTIEFESIYFVGNVAVDKVTNLPLENKNISLLNRENNERLPIDFEYSNTVTPHPELKKKGFSFNTDFKSSCDCEDDCYQRASCACHRLNEESAGKHAHNRGTVDISCQYKDKKLLGQVNTGLFECNSGCKCSSKCSNRVVQNGIRFRLQITKMAGNKGWGVTTLDDIPEGAFICTYAAELLDDADQYGNSDMYYADLDYITVNEQNKEGYEEDDDDRLDEGFGQNSEDNEEEEEGDDEDVVAGSGKKRKHDLLSSSTNSSSSSSISSLENGYVPLDEFEEKTEPSPKGKRYPKRKSAAVDNRQKSAAGNQDPERGVFKRLHQVLKSRDYTLDARMRGNIGRFFNHSCSPNAFVQNVFIESHDLRFPIVAFFSMKTIKATEEITWNYNYKTGSIEGRRIDCECGAANCQGRIL